MNYKLKNPRDRIETAEIFELEEFSMLTVKFIGLTMSSGMFKNKKSAKSYYTKYYQSSKWGYDKPIWIKY